MSDLVEHLRTGNHPTCKNMYALGDPEDICCDHCSERLAAADEIERLRTKLDEIATEILDVTTPKFAVDTIDVSVLRTLALEIKGADR